MLIMNMDDRVGPAVLTMRMPGVGMQTHLRVIPVAALDSQKP